jgi:uncharacterized protein (DUF488 family)
METVYRKFPHDTIARDLERIFLIKLNESFGCRIWSYRYNVFKNCTGKIGDRTVLSYARGSFTSISHQNMV